jgi:hypothetical protein
MSTWNQIRRLLYFTQRTMGDISAARRGPAVLAKRLVRRQLTRRTWGRAMDGLFR